MVLENKEKDKEILNLKEKANNSENLITQITEELEQCKKECMEKKELIKKQDEDIKINKTIIKEFQDDLINEVITIKKLTESNLPKINASCVLGVFFNNIIENFLVSFLFGLFVLRLTGFIGLELLILMLFELFVLKISWSFEFFILILLI